MSTVLSPILQEAQFNTTTGEFLAGGTIEWYIDQTSNFQTVYTDKDGLIPHTNPIVLNARGEPPSQIWLADGAVYKAVLKDAAGVVITTYTGIEGINTTGIAQQEWIPSTIVPTFVSETSFTVPGDNTGLLHIGRRLKLIVTAGTIYATVRTTTYAAPNTTVVVYNDNGVLDAGLLEFSYSVLSATNPAIPGNLNAQNGNVFRKNYLDNGDFDIWQREIHFVADGVTADRWRMGVLGSTFVADRIDVALGNYAVDEGPTQPRYQIQVDVTGVAGGANFAKLSQRIESVLNLNSKYAVLSFWARCTVGTKNISIEFVQNFGTGGAPSASVTAIGVKKFTLSTTYQKFVLPFLVPSISGKTLGTDNNDSLTMNIWLDAGIDFNARTNTLGHQTGVFRFSRFQLENGQIPSDFEKRGLYEEIFNCRRFFRKSFPFNVIPTDHLTGSGAVRGIASIAGASINYFGDVRFDPPMRGDPTIVLYNPGVGGPIAQGEAFNATDAVNCSNTAATATSDTLLWNTTGNATCTVGDKITVHYTADAEL